MESRNLSETMKLCALKTIMITSLTKGLLILSLLCLLSVLLSSAYLFGESGGNGKPMNSRLISHLFVFKDSWFTESHHWTEPMKVEPLVRANISEFGYMLALSFSDQLTGSVTSLLSLQCLASALHPKLRVVEPFLDISILGVDPAHREDNKYCQMNRNDSNYLLSSIKLTDLFSAEHWHKASKQMAPLVSWDYFIHNAQSKLIVVNRQCDKNFVSLDGTTLECTDIGEERFNRSIRVFQKCYGFEVVRRVYFTSNSSYSQSAFKELIYGDFLPGNVTVLFNFWGGIEKGQVRVQITDAKGSFHCNRFHFFNRANIPLSQRLIADAQKYKEKYITRGKDMEGYISVMVRLEFIHFNKLRRESKKLIDEVLANVYSNIMKQVEVYKAKHKIQNVFLTMDCREQGSLYFNSNVSVDAEDWKTRKLVAASISDLYEMLYGNTSSLTEWDDSFYDIASFRNPGYIGQLQKYLAAHGNCLITMGGGTFQDTARKMFRHSHNGADRYCFQDIKMP